MSELKARHVVDVYDDYAEHTCEDCSQVYLKSEADRYIRRLKRKRCLAMAEWCWVKSCSYDTNSDFGFLRFTFYRHWCKRWDALAEKFKEEQ